MPDHRWWLIRFGRVVALVTVLCAGRDAEAQHAGHGAPSTSAGHGAGGGHGAHGPGGGHHNAESCAAEFEKVVADGRGFGMAFAADQNGYPGPLHVLELKDRLMLTAEQESTMTAMLAAMFAEARPKGARLLEAERRLERLFAEGRADEATVRTAVAEVEQARSEVRLVHLLMHLRTRDLLTPDQRRLYHDARWPPTARSR